MFNLRAGQILRSLLLMTGHYSKHMETSRSLLITGHKIKS
jgi:hypothetical protein